MKSNQSRPDTDLTRERLLDTAETLFAEKGYHGVSVREITTSASCNLAAVNYHFGNKQNLYMEVFRSRWIPRAKRVYSTYLKSLAEQDQPSPAGIVQALAHAFLRGPLSGEERRRHSQLIVREMSQPTEAFDLVFTQVIGPLQKALAEQLRDLLPEKASMEDLKLDILSVFSMTLYFNFARPLITAVMEHEYDDAFTARLIQHIARFSMHGLTSNKRED